MIFEVHYRIDTRDFVSSASASVPASNYKHVVSLDATDLEDLFRRMNVVDGSDIEMPRRLRCRSMSVGDIAIDTQGKAHFCASAGWEETEITE